MYTFSFFKYRHHLYCCYSRWLWLWWTEMISFFGLVCGPRWQHLIPVCRLDRPGYRLTPGWPNLNTFMNILLSFSDSLMDSFSFLPSWLASQSRWCSYLRQSWLGTLLVSWWYSVRKRKKKSSYVSKLDHWPPTKYFFFFTERLLGYFYDISLSLSLDVFLGAKKKTTAGAPAIELYIVTGRYTLLVLAQRQSYIPTGHFGPASLLQQPPLALVQE